MPLLANDVRAVAVILAALTLGHLQIVPSVRVLCQVMQTKKRRQEPVKSRPPGQDEGMAITGGRLLHPHALLDACAI
jgi:hypothetical protein